jgi:valyl-tRNA synthetase
MAAEIPRITTPAGGIRRVAGSTPKQAQHKIVELLVESGEMLGEPRPISPVKFYERGTRPLRSSPHDGGTSATAVATTISATHC